MTEHLAANERRALLLLGGFSLVVGLIVWAISWLAGHPSIGLLAAMAAAVAVAIGCWRWADRIVLRSLGADPADPRLHARYVNLVDGLCSAFGVPRPKLYVMDWPALNALACGRSPRRAALVVTSGLLDDLTRIELEGVLAHELCHVKSGDAMLSTVTAATVGLLPMAYDWAVGAVRPAPRLVSAARSADASSTPDASRGSEVSAPAAGRDAGPGRTLARWTLAGPAALSAMLMGSMLDPGREGRADVRAMSITRFPPGLISALEKMSQSPDSVPRRYGTAHLWLDSPLSRPSPAVGSEWLDRRLAPAQDLQERIEALRVL